MRVAEPRRPLARSEVARTDVGEPAQLRIDERDVDELPDVAAGGAVVARIERREHADAGVDAARDVGHRRGEAAGPAVDRAGERHQAGFALRDDVVAAAIGFRPRVPVAADRAVHEPRMPRAQRRRGRGRRARATPAADCS